MDVTDNSVMIIGRNKGGRPRAIEPKSAIASWVPTSIHDKIAKEALTRDQSVSQVIAEVLTQRFKG
jgi:predicted HicB family RNase H-like nuclease